jgi:hypothetical protein
MVFSTVLVLKSRSYITLKMVMYGRNMQQPPLINALLMLSTRFCCKWQKRNIFFLVITTTVSSRTNHFLRCLACRPYCRDIAAMASRTERTEGDTERKTGEESHPLHTSTPFKTLCGVSVRATTESSSQHTFVSLVATQLTLLRFKPQTKITEARNQGCSVFLTI